LLLERITMMMMDPFRQRDRHSLWHYWIGS
jgi:hypothetical protein